MGKGGDKRKGATLDTTDANEEPEMIASTDASRIHSSHWWNRGGMHANLVGMSYNIVAPVVFLGTGVSPVLLYVFLATLGLNIASAVLVHKMKTVFCTLTVPLYTSSLLFIFSLRSPLPILAISVVLAMAKVGFCMSVCLHRYAAHAAFKCGPITQLFLFVLGSLAHQGGPIWWASQHRCHHKHCDLPRDPHAAVQVGTEKAFAFFDTHIEVEEEFAPKHMDNWYLRVLDTFSFIFVTLEMITAYYLYGREGLFVAYTSTWICQTITLWFNIANHPEDVPGVCKASNFKAKPHCYYPAFHFLDFLYPFFAVVVGEGAHEDHHTHFMLAKRDSTDCAYYGLVMPMQSLGLVWDVKMLPAE